MELFIERLEKRGFVVAVGAPRTPDGDDDDLVAEGWIGLGDLVAIEGFA